MKNTSINPTVWQPLSYANFKIEKPNTSNASTSKKRRLPKFVFLKMKFQK